MPKWSSLLSTLFVATSAVVVLAHPFSSDGVSGQTPDDKIVLECSLDICIMNPDGSGKQNLIDDQKSDTDPELSPDGTRIAWAATQPAMYDGVERQQPDRNYAWHRNIAGAPWSPDGSRLVYVCVSPVNFSNAICTINADGSDKQLIYDPGDDILQVRQPDWSPDGSKIAFQGNPLTFEHDDDIFVMDANGSGVVNLTNTEERTERNAAWSPDGTKIAFYSSRPSTEGGQSALYTMNPDGSDRDVLATPPNGAGAGGVTWSPDGSQIAIECNVDDLCVMDANTGDLVRQLPSGAELWSTYHWGYAGGPPPLPIEDQLGSCLDNVNIAYGRDNAGNEWLAYEPEAPVFLQTLHEFGAGSGFLVNLATDCTITSGVNNIPLYAGWNLFGWRDVLGQQGEVELEDQLGACFGSTNIAYGHDNQSKTWLAFEPGAPDFLQTLHELALGGGYLINVTAGCVISDGPNNVPLAGGWNLFGWQ